VVATLFDGAELAAGARAAGAVFGPRAAPVPNDVERAAAGRADAYAVIRLYATLELVVALMFMGVAKKAEKEGRRDMWSISMPGRATIAFRTRVGEALTAYDDAKRAPALRCGKTYTSQTAGYVAALQEQAAQLAAEAHEPHSPLLEALQLGLGVACVFRAGRDREPCSFWESCARVAEQRLHGADSTDSTEYDGPRAAPLEQTIAMVCSMIVFGQSSAAHAAHAASAHAASASVGGPSMVQTRRPLRDAMAEASRTWPRRGSFHGREYADTERKVTAKAAREGRDSRGREVGECLGYRLEWLGYLANGAPAPPAASAAADACAFVPAAATQLAHAEVLSRDGGAPVLPTPGGNAVHYVHGVALAAEPQPQPQPQPQPLVERPDAKYLAAAARLREGGDHLGEKQLFVERVVEKVAPLYKAWSGGVLATGPFYDFFAEVWRRFNASLRAEGSPWAEKLKRWLAHYHAGTTPPRANGEAKLIHPWRVMHLQKRVAKTLLHERYGEPAVLALEAGEARAAMRVRRALVGALIDVYDYAPWAAHVMRRFCSMEEHRAAKRRRETFVSALVPPARLRLPGALSPSLARAAGPANPNPDPNPNL